MDGSLNMAMRRAAALVVLLLLLLAPLASHPARAQDPVQILAIDTYAKSVAPGQAAWFNWTVRNIDVLPYNVTVGVNPVPGWNTTVAPSTITDLLPSHATPVQVTVRAPAEVTAATTATIQVLFTVYEDGAIVFLASRSANVSVPNVYAAKRVLGIFANPLPPPLDTAWGVFLLDVVLWLAIAGLVLLILVPLLRRLDRITKTQVGTIALRILRTPILILLFLYGAIQSLSALDQYVPAVVQSNLLTVYQVLVAIVGLYLAYRIFKDVVVAMARNIAKRTSTNIDDVLVPIVEKVGVVVIALAGLGLLLGYLNVDLTLFVAGGVVTSMVVAFAAQDSLSNFFSGIFLLTDRPFQEGDVVILNDGDWVQVRRIGMRTTRLFRFSDASIVTLPNNKLVNDKIANFSNPADKGRVMKTFNVAYGSDPLQVKKILADVISRCPLLFQEDPLKPIIRFDAMSDSSLDFFVLVWVKNRDDRFNVQDYLNTEVYKAFGEAGIEIPFPQRTVHLQMEDAGSPGKRTAPLDVERMGEDPGARGRGESKNAG